MIDRIRETILATGKIKNLIIESLEDSIHNVYLLPKDPNHGYAISTDKKKTKGWAMVYDISYSKTTEKTDPEFNTDLWISNYTGEAIPRGHMQEWVDTTVARVLKNNPRKDGKPSVLEIGCGSGLLLYPLLPHISKYVGVDNAEEGLKLITKQCQNREHGEKVELFVADALSVAELDLEAFDIIVINSVTQYFPSVEYLIAVIKGLEKLMKKDSLLFIGDIRSRQLQRSFFADTLFDKLDGELDMATFRKKLATKIRIDKESIFGPAVFHKLKEQFPFITKVETQQRRGKQDNEMTLFRYDVLISNKHDEGQGSKVKRVNWSADAWSMEAVRNIMSDSAYDHVIITNVPNKRLSRSAQILAALDSVEDGDTLSQFRSQIASSSENVNTALTPEDFWNLENDQYKIEVDWNYPAEGQMEVRLLKKGSAFYSPAQTVNGLAQLSNQIALKEKNALIDEIKAELDVVLPPENHKINLYMITQDLYNLAQ